MLRKIVLGILGLFAVAAHAQYARMDFSLTSSQGVAIAGAGVTLQAQTACGTYTGLTTATVYASASGASPVSTAPQLTTDGFGHAFGYVSPGCYTITYSSPLIGTNVYQDQAAVNYQGVYCSITGCTLSGAFTAPTISGVYQASAMAGADACAKINAAVLLIGSGEGVIDARGLTGAQSCSSNPFNSGTGVVWLQLGSTTITSSLVGAWTFPSAMANSIMTGAKGATNITFAPASSTNNGISVQAANVTIEGINFTGNANIGRIIDARSVNGTRIRNNSFSTAGFVPVSGPNAAVAIGNGGTDQWVTDNTFTNIGNCATVNQSSFDITADTSTAPGNLRMHVRNNQISGSCTNASIVLYDCVDCDAIGNTIDQNNKIRSDTNTSGGYGILFYDLNVRPARGIVSNNDVRNTAGSAYYFVVCDSCTIGHNVAYNTGQQETNGTLPVASYALNDVYKTAFVGNTSNTATIDCIDITTDGSPSGNGGEIADNTCLSTTVSAIKFGGTGLNNYAVHNNLIDTAVNGIIGATSSTLSAADISHNTITNVTASPILFYTLTDSGINYNTIPNLASGFVAIDTLNHSNANISVQGNVIDAGAVATTVGIDLSGVTNGVVSGNVIKGIGSGGTCVIADTGTSGLNISNNVCGAGTNGITTTSATNSLITGNRVFSTTKITKGSSDTAMDNLFTTNGVLSGKGPAMSAGTVTVTNAEIQTGDQVLLSNCGLGGTAGTLELGTISSGVNFVINSSSGADTSTPCYRIVH